MAVAVGRRRGVADGIEGEGVSSGVADGLAAVSEGAGVGDSGGVGVSDEVGDALADSSGVGVGEADGVGVLDGVGEGVLVGTGLGFGEREAFGLGDAVLRGVGVGECFFVVVVVFFFFRVGAGVGVPVKNCFTLPRRPSSAARSSVVPASTSTQQNPKIVFFIRLVRLGRQLL